MSKKKQWLPEYKKWHDWDKLIKKSKPIGFDKKNQKDKKK